MGMGMGMCCCGSSSSSSSKSSSSSSSSKSSSSSQSSSSSKSSSSSSSQSSSSSTSCVQPCCPSQSFVTTYSFSISSTNAGLNGQTGTLTTSACNPAGNQYAHVISAFNNFTLTITCEVGLSGLGWYMELAGAIGGFACQAGPTFLTSGTMCGSTNAIFGPATFSPGSCFIVGQTVTVTITP